MKNRNVPLLLFCVLPLFHAANGQAINNNFRATNIMMRTTKMSSADLIMGIPSSHESSVIGDSYWDTHWGASALLLYDKDQLVDGHLTRYDIKNDEYEFLINKQVRVLPGIKVKQAVWLDSLTQSKRFLVNAKEYTTDGVPLTGCFEVLADGRTALFKRMYLEIKKPDFNAALNVGSKDTRIVKREHYYFNLGREVYKIKSKKDVAVVFQDKAEQMNAYIKSEKIKFSDEANLIKVFTSYLSL
jgi:hypothetical protein